MTKKIFLTGGTGFLGSYIIKELVERGYEIKALRRGNVVPFYIDKKIFAKVEWIQGDVLDITGLIEGMHGCDAVIHAAGKVSFQRRDRESVYQINVEGTANVVNAAIEANVTRFVHISSIAAIGRSATGDLVTEEKKWQPSKINTHYAISKYHAEIEAWRGMGEGLDMVIANPSTIIGFGDWNTSSCAMYKNAYKEFPWYTDGINSFVDVEDVARAVVQLMDSKISNERFIISSETWPFQQLFNTMADALGKKRPSRLATRTIGKLAWRLEKLKSFFTGKKPLLTRETARIAHSKTNFSNRKILEALPGFSFTPLKQSIDTASKKYLNPLQPL
ncbi:MAG: NAD-dependent epimerase/dehydratase family protein [Chitinophagaceae bacterium]|nr:NAD-dependent epimerase/dehydratase family protein [Chitinophagaceae bacterium]